MVDRRGRYADDATPDVAIEHASAALRICGPSSDPMFPIALLRGKALLGQDPDATALLERWAPGVTRETGSVRYRWPINPMFAGRWPAWVGPPATWQPWRTRDVAAWADPGPTLDRRYRATPDASHPGGQPRPCSSTTAGETTPAAISHAYSSTRPCGRRAAMRPRGSSRHARGPTPGRCGRSLVGPQHSPCSIHSRQAIADSYAASAAKTDGRVLGSRFPVPQ